MYPNVNKWLAVDNGTISGWPLMTKGHDRECNEEKGERAYDARKEIEAGLVRVRCTTGDEKETRTWIKCD